MSIIGSKLPEPFFTRLMTAPAAARRLRKCPRCQWISTTVEIPFHPRDNKVPGDACPNHPRMLSVTISSLSSSAALKRGSIGQGPLACISMGGYYRRRGCRLNFLKEVKGSGKSWVAKPPEQILCKDPKGNPSRWSTIELDAAGVVTKDIAICANCGAQNHSFRGTHERAERWRD